jgi:hypothetical protein
LAAESWTAQELLAARWSDADLAWEKAAERTLDAITQNDIALAKDSAALAVQIARASFASIDPRLGTSLANYGLCLTLAGDDRSVEALLREALEVWRGASPWVDRMEAPRVARSSLFHMRMEALHRDTYRERWLKRWRETVIEAKERLNACDASADRLATAAQESLTRWRRERPAMLNDTRKLFAAAFLLLAPTRHT